TRETVTATPTTTLRLAGIPQVVPNGAPPVTTSTFAASSGGVFAQPTNIGHYTRDVFAVVPEVNLKVGYQLNNSWRATVGYTFLFMSNVVRPGDEIDRGINSGFLALPPNHGLPLRPAFDFSGSGSTYWAQGVDFGLEFHF